MDPVPITRLERDWRRELANPALARRLRSWQMFEPALRPFANPLGLLRYLRRSHPGEREDAVLRALLARARYDQLAAHLVLVRLLPGLKARAGRVLLEADEREELWSSLLARGWERIRSYPVRRLPRHVAANLVLSTVRDVLEALAEERDETHRFAGAPSISLADRSHEEVDVDGALEDAVKTGAISGEEAELIASTRLDAVPLEEAAAERGVSRHTLVVRRLRAEQRLALALGLGRVTHRRSKPPLSGARVAGAGSPGPRRCK